MSTSCTNYRYAVKNSSKPTKPLLSWFLHCLGFNPASQKLCGQAAEWTTSFFGANTLLVCDTIQCDGISR